MNVLLRRGVWARDRALEILALREEDRQIEQTAEEGALETPAFKYCAFEVDLPKESRREWSAKQTEL